MSICLFFFFSSRRRHTRCLSDWSSDVCSSDLQMVRKGDVKLCILQPKTLGRPTSGCHHRGNRINSKDLAFRSDPGSHAQCRLSGARSNIQNRVLPANLSIFDESLCNRRKHLLDDFAVLLPVRSGTAPSVYDLLVGLHERRYSCFASFRTPLMWSIHDQRFVTSTTVF